MNSTQKTKEQFYMNKIVQEAHNYQGQTKDVSKQTLSVDFLHNSATSILLSKLPD